MKVRELEVGQLYTVDPSPSLMVAVFKDNWLQIYKSGYRAPKDYKDPIKGRPALYCGVSKEKANYYKQGWIKAHRFLISGESYLIHGDSIRYIRPLFEIRLRI